MRSRVSMAYEYVNVRTIVRALKRFRVPRDFLLLKIDIDSFDFHVFRRSRTIFGRSSCGSRNLAFRGVVTRSVLRRSARCQSRRSLRCIIGTCPSLTRCNTSPAQAHRLRCGLSTVRG